MGGMKNKSENHAGYKYIYERYCPNVQHNVVVEESVDVNGHIIASCHHHSACEEEHGGCQNSMLSMEYNQPRVKNTRLNWDSNTL